jgi:hypothetical protein
VSPPPSARAVSTTSSTSTQITPTTSPSNKKKSNGGRNNRFREYQAQCWSQKLAEAKLFRIKYGHCLIPHEHAKNQALALWAKRQRYQYKLLYKTSGSKKSSLTSERIKALEEIDFCWNPQKTVWSGRYDELCQYTKEHGGHANVPTNYTKNPQLAVWVKCQRRQYKLWLCGEHSTVNEKRVTLLESIGFEWTVKTGMAARKAKIFMKKLVG